MKICLCKEMVIMRNLTYEEVKEALILASNNHKMKEWSFFMTNLYSEAPLYSLIAKYNPLVQDFIKHSEDYIIEI